MSKVAFFTVVFPSVAKYLNDFFDSLIKQSIRDFDVIIVNDGIAGLQDLLHQYSDLNIIHDNYHNTPSKIREYCINNIKSMNYDIIIFGDADDYFEGNRVYKCLELLENYDIVVNDFVIVDADKNELEKSYLSKRVKNGDIINYDFIIDKNLFGLSNTAIRTSTFNDITFDENLIAVDWFFFSILLRSNRAVFTNETLTYYRQHSDNTIGIGDFDFNKLKSGLEVKLLHYKLMSEVDSKFFNLYEKFKELNNRLEIDESFLDEYILRIKESDIYYPLWWEEIRLPGEGD